MESRRPASALRDSDLAVIVAGGAVFLLALGALVAVGLASLLFGRGWVWPPGVAGAVSELGALVTGDPAGGLDDASARRVPGAAAVWVVVVIVEFAVVALVVALVRVVNQGHRPPSDRASRAEAATALGRRRRNATSAAWPLGRSRHLRGVPLWVPFERTAGVIGPGGAVLAQAALAAPHGLLQASMDPDAVLLTLTRRSRDGRPVAVCDPFGLLPGLPPLVWDPLAGCVDAAVASRRARAFTAGTVLGAEADAAKVLRGYLHAAALTGRTFDHVMDWVADPLGDHTAETILAEHPHAEPHWAAMLRGALRDSPGTVETLQQTMAMFMYRDLVRGIMPSSRQRATDIADLIGRGGTIYLLGKDDPATPTLPLLTAIADDVLGLGSPCVAVLDALPSTAPVPMLGRLPVPVVWAAADRQDLVTCYGDDAAHAILEATDLLVHVEGDDAVVSTSAAPSIHVRLRPVEAAVLAERDEARTRVDEYRARRPARRDPYYAAVNAAREHGLHAESATPPVA
jgi:type IV secretion system protein VirD4